MVRAVSCGFSNRTIFKNRRAVRYAVCGYAVLKQVCGLCGSESGVRFMRFSTRCAVYAVLCHFEQYCAVLYSFREIYND